MKKIQETLSKITDDYKKPSAPVIIIEPVTCHICHNTDCECDDDEYYFL